MKVYDLGLLIILFLLFAPALSHDHHQEKPTDNKPPITQEQLDAYFTSFKDSALVQYSVILVATGLWVFLITRFTFTLSTIFVFIYSGASYYVGYDLAKIPLILCIVGLIIYLMRKPDDHKNVGSVGKED